MYTLIDTLIPLSIAILILAKPQLFTKKDLKDPENINLKKKLSNIGKILIVASVLIFIANIGKLTNSNEISTGDLIEQIVLKGNEQFPKKIDEYTTIEKLTGKENTIYYHYSLHGMDYSQVSKEEFIDITKKNLINIASNQEHIKGFRERDIQLQHIYKDPNSSFEATVVLRPGEY